MKTRAALLLFCAFTIAAGTKKMTVEDSLAIHRVAGPKFSPDSNWIVYTQSDWDRKNDRQISHIWIARSNGSGTAARLTNGEKGETSPQWSPDGTHIAFLADRGTGDSKNGAQIWLIRPNGGEADKLTSEENPVTAFQWAPNGSRIAFITRDTPSDKA